MRWLWPSATNRYRCCGSDENAMSHTEPFATRLLRDDRFLDERAVFLEDLDAVARAIADVDRAVLRDRHAGHRAELLGRRRRRIVGGRVRVFRRRAVRAPVPFVRARGGIEHDDAAIAVAIGDVQLVGGRVELDVGGTVERRLAGAAVGRAGLADLLQELAVARELQNVRVVTGRRRGGAARVSPRAPPHRRVRRHARAAARAPAGSGQPAAAIHTLPLGSTAIPPGVCGQS